MNFVRHLLLSVLGLASLNGAHAQTDLPKGDFHSPILIAFNDFCWETRVDFRRMVELANQSGWSTMRSQEVDTLLWGIVGNDRRGWVAPSPAEPLGLVVQSGGRTSADQLDAHMSGEFVTTDSIETTRQIRSLMPSASGVIGRQSCHLFGFAEHDEYMADEIFRQFGEPTYVHDRIGVGRQEGLRMKNYLWIGFEPYLINLSISDHRNGSLLPTVEISVSGPVTRQMDQEAYSLD